MGFDAGDDINFFSLDESQTPRILDTQCSSNVDTPGRWIFRVDESTISADVCSTTRKLIILCYFTSSYTNHCLVWFKLK